MSTNEHEKTALDKLKAGFEEFKEGFLANAAMVRESLDLTFGGNHKNELPNPGSVDLDLDYPKKQSSRPIPEGYTAPSPSSSKSHAGPSSSSGAMTGEKLI